MPNYSDQDIKFLKALKQQGVPAEEALGRLQQMKGGMTSSPSSQPTTPPGQPDLSAMQSQIQGAANFGASLGNPGAMIGNAIGSNAGMIGNAILDSTIKPFARGAATASVGPLIAGGKQLATGQGIEEPIDVPWLGNINPNANTPLEQVGVAGDFGMSAANMFIPSTKVGVNALRGGIQAGSQAAQEDDATAESILASGAFGAATSAAMTGLTNKFTAWLNKGTNAKTFPTKLEKEALNAGIKPDAIKRVQTLGPEDKVTQSQLIDLARQNLDDPDNVQTPMEKIANDMNDDMRELYRVMQEKGAAIGQIKGDVITGQADAPNINVQDLRKDFLTSLAKKGVVVGKDGKLSFNKSTFKNQKGDQKALMDVWNSIRKVQEIPTGQGLILREQLQGDLYGGKVRGDITTAEKFITDFERGLTRKIHADNPDLAELDDVFYNLKKAVSGFDDKTGGSILLTTDEALDGTNTFNLLRKSLGSGANENKKIVTALQKVGEKYNLPTLSKVLNLRRLAQTAEDIVGTDILSRPTSFAGRAFNAGKAVMSGARGDVVGAGQAVKDVVSKQPLQAPIMDKLLNQGAQQAVKENAKRLAQQKAVKGMADLLQSASKYNILSPHVGKALGSFFKY